MCSWFSQDFYGCWIWMIYYLSVVMMVCGHFLMLSVQDNSVHKPLQASYALHYLSIGCSWYCFMVAYVTDVKRNIYVLG